MVYYFVEGPARLWLFVPAAIHKSQECEPSMKLRTASAARPSFPSARLLSLVCVLVLVAGVLPLYAISLYNHPYFDDYNFAAATHAVWQDTHSLPAVLTAALKSAKTARNAWQGTYTGTLLSTVQPGMFSERLYFLTTFFLLTAFLLCFGFFFSVVFHGLLGLKKTETVTLVSLALTLLVQFMPDPDEAFFWFNGGIGNTFIYSLLFLSLGLCLKLEQAQTRRGRLVLMLPLVVLMALLGGGSYGGGVFGLCVYGLLLLWAFARKRPARFLYAALFTVFLGCFLYSVFAPGNAVRAGYMGTQISPVKAVLQALYYGVALMGSYVRLPLLAVTALLLPAFFAAAKKSPFLFRHPLLVLGAGMCLYCTQFAPPLYAGGVGIGGGRIVDTYYQSFVVMWFLYAFYLAGVVARRLEARPEGAPSGLVPWKAVKPSPRLRQGFLLACCFVLLVGCLAWKRPHDATYGPQNMAGGSAALSILRGEAQAYHREMTAREALLRDASQPEVTLAPLSAVPDIFMKDLLVADAPYEVRPSLCTYYGKTAIHLAVEEAR